MARSFSQLQAEVFHDEFDATKYAPLVQRWLNEAAQKFAREVQLPSQLVSTTITLPAGTSTYTVPDDWEVIENIWNGTNPLDEIDPDDAQMDTSNGNINSFAIYGRTLTFRPAPVKSTTLTVRYQLTVSDMVNDQDPVSIPEDYADVLVSYARSKAFAMEDDFEGSAFYRQLWEDGLSRARSRLQLRTRNRVRQISGMLGDGYTGPPRFFKP